MMANTVCSGHDIKPDMKTRSKSYNFTGPVEGQILASSHNKLHTTVESSKH